MIGALVALAATLSPAAPGDAGKDWVWTTDGKRWTRTEQVVRPVVLPTTTVVDVPAGEGDSWRMAYVGKRMERVSTREVPRPAPPTGHECGWRLRYEGKRTTREKVCVIDGVAHPYERAHPGSN